MDVTDLLPPSHCQMKFSQSASTYKHTDLLRHAHELSKCHCNVNKARAFAVFQNNDQAPSVGCAARSVVLSARCVVYSACLSGRSNLAKSAEVNSLNQPSQEVAKSEQQTGVTELFPRSPVQSRISSETGKALAPASPVLIR